MEHSLFGSVKIRAGRANSHSVFGNAFLHVEKQNFSLSVIYTVIA